MKSSGFFFILFALIAGISCTKKDESQAPVFILKTGVQYTSNGASVPLGGKITIGILASGAVTPITYIRIEKLTGNDTVLELDKGVYIGPEGMDADFTFSKDTSASEVFRITLMNASRLETSQFLKVIRGSGSAFGEVSFFPSMVIGHQENTILPHYLDADQGQAFTLSQVAGHEGEIDMVCYYYVTSGKNSPTLTCPGYTAAVGYYPAITSWSQKNMTLYDYYSADNNLVSVADFDAADNDSLLVNAFRPGLVSGNCKYCYSGKVIPFKTQQSKYGLIKIIRADESAGGSMEVAIKIQQ